MSSYQGPGDIVQENREKKKKTNPQELKEEIIGAELCLPGVRSAVAVLKSDAAQDLSLVEGVRELMRLSPL